MDKYCSILKMKGFLKKKNEVTYKWPLGGAKPFGLAPTSFDALQIYK